MSKQHTFDDVVNVYRQIREKLAERRKEWQAYEKAQNEKLERLRGHMLNQFNKLGVDSVKTPSGTAYKTPQIRVSIDDADAFYKFMLDRQDPALLQKRVAKEHTLEVIEELRSSLLDFSPADIGIKIDTLYDIGVRKS